MKSRISKKVREEAALICAIAASGGIWSTISNSYTRVYMEIFRSLGSPYYGSLGLAIRAVSHGRGAWTCEADAEAEALIRSGWSPS